MRQKVCYSSVCRLEGRLSSAPCSRKFENVKLRPTIQESICQSILRKINFGKIRNSQIAFFYNLRDSEL